MKIKKVVLSVMLICGLCVSSFSSGWVLKEPKIVEKEVIVEKPVEVVVEKEVIVEKPVEVIVEKEVVVEKQIQCNKQHIQPKVANQSTEIKNNNEQTNNNGERYIGTFSSTAYCVENYPHICNNGDSSQTATGEKPIPGGTVAVDPSVIPLGSKLRIRAGGQDYIVRANDTGGAIKGKKIDRVMSTHNEALAWGRKNVEVWIIG